MQPTRPAPSGPLAALLEEGGAPRRLITLQAPQIAPWRAGNVLPGVWSFAGPVPGPHVAVVALMHGNEIAGAIVLDRLLRAGLRPAAGRLSLVFANLDAFSRFDPDDPTASRFLEEDLNRLWDPAVLEGARRSAELRRARALRPLFEATDILLDLHSMMWPSDPVVLTAGGEAGLCLAVQLGITPLAVADAGHRAGLRLIDHPRFAGPGAAARALLLEGGWHWEEATVERQEAAVHRLLGLCGLLPGPVPAAAEPCRAARVVRTVTAETADFTFTRPWRGGEVVPRAGTLIARDGGQEIRTPHDDCLLVMPNLLPQPGQTAVRLARFEPG